MRKLTVRQKIARSLRKWADLIDPRTPPREARESITFKIGIEGLEEFQAGLAKAQIAVNEIAARSAIDAERVMVRAFQRAKARMGVQ